MSQAPTPLWRALSQRGLGQALREVFQLGRNYPPILNGGVNQTFDIGQFLETFGAGWGWENASLNVPAGANGSWYSTQVPATENWLVRWVSTVKMITTVSVNPPQWFFRPNGAALPANGGYTAIPQSMASASTAPLATGYQFSPIFVLVPGDRFEYRYFNGDAVDRLAYGAVYRKIIPNCL